MTKDLSLEDGFLQVLQEEKTPVSIFLINGIKLVGQIDTFDENVVILKNNTAQLIFKHSISTIVPNNNPIKGVPAATQSS